MLGHRRRDRSFCGDQCKLYVLDRLRLRTRLRCFANFESRDSNLVGHYHHHRCNGQHERSIHAEFQLSLWGRSELEGRNQETVGRLTMRFKIQDHKLRKAESGTREVNYRGLKMSGGHNAFHLPPSACDLLLLALPLLLAAFCVSPFAFCSQMRGTGTVNACAGGPPRYCADTSMRIMGESAIMYPQIDLNDGGPAVGVPFIDPDTGTRITRITDGSLEIPSGRTNNNSRPTRRRKNIPVPSSIPISRRLMVELISASRAAMSVSSTMGRPTSGWRPLMHRRCRRRF